MRNALQKTRSLYLWKSRFGVDFRFVSKNWLVPGPNIVSLDSAITRQIHLRISKEATMVAKHEFEIPSQLRLSSEKNLAKLRSFLPVRLYIRRKSTQRMLFIPLWVSGPNSLVLVTMLIPKKKSDLSCDFFHRVSTPDEDRVRKSEKNLTKRFNNYLYIDWNLFGFVAIEVVGHFKTVSRMCYWYQ